MICPDCPAADQIDLMPEDVLRFMASEDIVGSVYPSVKKSTSISISLWARLIPERKEPNMAGSASAHFENRSSLCCRKILMVFAGIHGLPFVQVIAMKI